VQTVDDVDDDAAHGTVCLPRPPILPPVPAARCPPPPRDDFLLRRRPLCTRLCSALRLCLWTVRTFAAPVGVRGPQMHEKKGRAHRPRPPKPRRAPHRRRRRPTTWALSQFETAAHFGTPADCARPPCSGPAGRTRGTAHSDRPEDPPMIRTDGVCPGVRPLALSVLFAVRLFK
jgi:hypothetical protein